MQPPTRPSPGVVIWAALTVLALGLFAAMSLLTLPIATTRPSPTAQDPTTPDMSSAGATAVASPTAPFMATPTPDTASADPTAFMGLWLSALSAITALIGLASSLWFGWRKEGREMAQHQVELEKARLEIRKLEQELGAKGDNPKS